MFKPSFVRVAVSVAVLTAMAVLVAGGYEGASGTPAARNTPPPSRPVTAGSCQRKGGIHHVVEILFDNVHFNRDNPNVPSDVEMIPSVGHFIESNGTLLSNNHTHTAHRSHCRRCGSPFTRIFTATGLARDSPSSLHRLSAWLPVAAAQLERVLGQRLLSRTPTPSRARPHLELGGDGAAMARRSLRLGCQPHQEPAHRHRLQRCRYPGTCRLDREGYCCLLINQATQLAACTTAATANAVSVGVQVKFGVMHDVRAIAQLVSEGA